MKQQLDKIFYPKTIAVLGASDKKGSVGYALLKNLINSDFDGAVYPVNLNHPKVQGIHAYRQIKDIPRAIDLAIIATPSATVPDLIKECGELKIEGVIIISAGFKEAGAAGKKMFEKITYLGKKYGIRIIGPNCLGIINTKHQMNASFASRMALPGRLALISQSGALCTSILDWSLRQNVGFSHFVSIGSTLDIDFHHLIDYLGADSNTACILIYMESLKDARAFISAARAFARSKPIIVLKAGKSQEGAAAALSHTGTLAGNDLAFSTAFQRAGIIRVDTIAELFHCAQAFAMQPIPKGNRLGIITNAGGPGILATDYLVKNGGRLAKLSSTSISLLNKILSSSWSHKYPLDILGDASDLQYAAAIKTCLHDEEVDALLILLSPQAVTDATAVAKQLIATVKNADKTILTCWMGETDVEEARRLLEQNNIPTYRYPESAVNTFLQMHRYADNIQLLYETPPAIPEGFSPDKQQARQLIHSVLQSGRTQMTEQEGKQLLNCYDIAANRGMICKDAEAAVAFAEKSGFPVALKIASPDIAHKTDVGGVQLHIQNEEEVREHFHQMMASVKQQAPQARIEGILVEPMIQKRYELLIGANKDPIFGPLILFGMGGITCELYRDQNASLPPLNMVLAQRLIEGTKIFQLLKGYRNLPGVDLQELQFVLCKFAYLLMDFPELLTIDINPYVIDENGGLALDAHVVLDAKVVPDERHAFSHLVIPPYPVQYQKTIRLKNGQEVLLRPIRPEDEPLEVAMFEYLSKETIYFRFFGYLPKVNHQALTRFTQIDYDREMAIIAEVEQDGKKQMIGVVRIIDDPWKESTEYAIVVADPWQGQGLGIQMTEYILHIARERGIKKIVASVLVSNTGMLRIFKHFSFRFASRGQDVYDVYLDLTNANNPEQVVV